MNTDSLQKIGFVFPGFESSHILIILFAREGYVCLGSKQIGFVLQNRDQTHPGAMGAAILRLALNWVCFFAASGAAHFHNAVLTLTLRPFELFEIGFVLRN